MFDGRLKAAIDPVSDRLAEPLARLGATANGVTVFGLIAGVLAGVALAAGGVWLALALFVVNRICDGIDGALARRNGPTDVGGYLDIVSDFAVYAAIPIGFAAMDPGANAVAAAVLIGSFMISGGSFFAYSAIGAKRALATDYAGPKSIPFSPGLMEGGETIAFFVAMLLLPSIFPHLAVIFATLCVLTGILRSFRAIDDFEARRVEVAAAVDGPPPETAPLLLDSIATITPAAAGRIVVTGSHGGRAAVDFARGIAIRALVFNDGGGGKDQAGLAALAVMTERGIPAVAVDHASARIGEADETLAGVVSAANDAAVARGVAPGQTAREAVQRLLRPEVVARGDAVPRAPDAASTDRAA